MHYTPGITLGPWFEQGHSQVSLFYRRALAGDPTDWGFGSEGSPTAFIIYELAGVTQSAYFLDTGPVAPGSAGETPRRSTGSRPTPPRPPRPVAWR